MKRYTPGPWHVTGNAAQDLVCAGDKVIADCNTGDLPDTTKANARLIAAAPELLDALRNLVGYPCVCDVGSLLAQRIHAAAVAIAKAEGRQ